MMNVNTYEKLVAQHMSDCEAYGLSDSDLALSIMQSAEEFPDEEVKAVLASLPINIMNEISLKLSKYRKTGEYYLISSVGVSLDLSGLMKRISLIYKK